jgi:ribosomal protein S18 acetylase RimI-like enzyme
MAAVLSDNASPSHNPPITIRAIRPVDVEACARAAYAAHTTVAAAHNIPCEHPSLEFSIGMVANKVKDPNAAGFVAERDQQIVGSIFLNTFPDTPVAAIGPLTVEPAAEGSTAGRRLMQAALDEARQRGIVHVRLVQSPSHLRSLALYMKLGFEVREPLVLVSGKPSGQGPAGCDVRVATMGDIPSCNRLCVATYGFARSFELGLAIEQKAARVAARGDYISGYSTGLGFRCHAVADTVEDLKALIGSAPVVMGPGFFVPTRKGELLRWLLAEGFRASWPATLMTRGTYQEPTGAFLPSIAF